MSRLGEAWYTARLILSDEQLTRLGDILIPMAGIQVNVLIQTSKRAVFSYFAKPLSGHIARAFIEE